MSVAEGKPPVLDREHLNRALERCPRSEKGDPLFRDIGELSLFFDTDDVLCLVNKALYALEYQSSFHKKRALEAKELRQAAREQKVTALRNARPDPVPQTSAMGQVNSRALRRSQDVSDLEDLTVPDKKPEGPDPAEQALDEAFAKLPVKEGGS